MSLYHVGSRVEITDAPVKADRGVFDIVAVRPEREEGAARYTLHRVNARGEVQDEPPPFASAGWYRRNHRMLTAAQLDYLAKVIHRGQS